jgi:lipoxygenase homology domain-containing protein 1
MQVSIVGEAGDTGPIILESSANDFERGNKDTFFVQARNVGNIKAIQVR